MIGAPDGARARVDHAGGDRFRITLRQHVVEVDQPVWDGGEDSGPTPTELFVGSLASCVAFYARRFLSRRGLDAEGLTVTASFVMAGRPSRVGEIDLELQLATELTPGEQRAVLAFASRCTVHNTLMEPPRVRIEVAAPAGLAR
jgi:putative redox protein